jgi:hypothetical protein
MYIFDTTAKDSENRKVHASWLLGIPRVVGTFGHSSSRVFEPVVAVTPKGGMVDNYLAQWTDLCVLPLYPNLATDFVFNDQGDIVEGPVCIKLDGGPGRLGKSTREARLHYVEIGVDQFPGLQNTTASSQEQDGLYGPFQSACSEVSDDIVSERIAAFGAPRAMGLDDEPRGADEEDDADAEGGEGGLAVLATTAGEKLQRVQLTNSDLGRIVNGRPSDPLEKRPFERSFTPEKVLAAWAKCGSVPMTRAALEHPKVRHEASCARDPLATTIQALVARHKASLAEIESTGGNAHVLNVS